MKGFRFRQDGQIPPLGNVAFSDLHRPRQIFARKLARQARFRGAPLHPAGAGAVRVRPSRAGSAGGCWRAWPPPPPRRGRASRTWPAAARHRARPSQGRGCAGVHRTPHVSARWSYHGHGMGRPSAAVRPAAAPAGCRPEASAAPWPDDMAGVGHEHRVVGTRRPGFLLHPIQRQGRRQFRSRRPLRLRDRRHRLAQIRQGLLVVSVCSCCKQACLRG